MAFSYVSIYSKVCNKCWYYLPPYVVNISDLCLGQCYQKRILLTYKQQVTTWYFSLGNYWLQQVWQTLLQPSCPGLSN